MGPGGQLVPSELLMVAIEHPNRADARVGGGRHESSAAVHARACTARVGSAVITSICRVRACPTKLVCRLSAARPARATTWIR
ncbi:hypothetical protein BIV25_19940 [Streptomyces sp. MUSC 14]|nr:hypothetical protein BIV25_19940 [Streptomyces sp. MUSC 14]